MINLNRAAIKIVKRNIKAAVKKPQTFVAVVKGQREIQLEIVNAVSGWISERRENSRIEKLFSDDTIIGWKSTPLVSKT